MNEDGNNELDLDADTDLTPLRVAALEIHEIYLELEEVGFPESMLTGIVAHMLSDAMMYRAEYEIVEDDDDDLDDEYFEDDDDEEGNLENGSD